MAYEFRVRRRVEFSETDMAGIVHFSNYARWMESTEHAFFRSVGLVAHRQGETMFGWARLHMSCDFLRPLRYGQEFDGVLVVIDRDDKTQTFGFRFERVLEDGGAECTAVGKMKTIYVERAAPGDPIKARSIPDDVRARIDVAPDEVRQTWDAVASRPTTKPKGHPEG